MDFVARASFGHTWSSRLSFEILSVYVHFVGNTDYLDFTLGLMQGRHWRPWASRLQAFMDLLSDLVEGCMLSFPPVFFVIACLLACLWYYSVGKIPSEAMGGWASRLSTHSSVVSRATSAERERERTYLAMGKPNTSSPLHPPSTP